LEVRRAQRASILGPHALKSALRRNGGVLTQANLTSLTIP
jgi:hypothetical protein